MSRMNRRNMRRYRRFLSQLFSKQYIPTANQSTSITLGSILSNRRNGTILINGEAFNDGIVAAAEGQKRNDVVSSHASFSTTLKMNGEAKFTDVFAIEDLGVKYEVNGKNEIFLKMRGVREISLQNFAAFRNKILKAYARGELSARVHIVTGVIYADKYHLFINGSRDSSLFFNLSGNVNNPSVNADFSLIMAENAQLSINGMEGGVLGYTVSSVRLKRHAVSDEIRNRLLDNNAEEDVLDNTSFTLRNELLENDGLEVVDVTSEACLELEDEDQ